MINSRMKQDFDPFFYSYAWLWYSKFGNYSEIWIYPLGKVFSFNNLGVLFKAQNFGMRWSWSRKTLSINLLLKSMAAKDFYCWLELGTLIRTWKYGSNSYWIQCVFLQLHIRSSLCPWSRLGPWGYKDQ